MARTTPPPVARLGTFSAAAKTAQAAAHDAADARAFVRWQVAQFAATVAASGASEREAWRRVVQAIDGGLLPPRAPSSRSAVRLLCKAWQDGQHDVADYRDAPRCGRPKVVAAPLVDAVRLAVRLANYGSLRQLSDRVARDATRQGLPVPSYESVRRLVATEGRCVRAASAYGSRVAQQEALPLGTVPAQAIHDAWVVDEATLPFWIRAFDVDTATWFSTRPTLISVVDHKSSACVGYWVADPTAHRDVQTGAIARSGYDTQDVMTALLAAALPECATPATAAFTGHLPMALRWDNHATHQLLRRSLEGWDQQPIPTIRAFFPDHEDEAALPLDGDEATGHPHDTTDATGAPPVDATGERLTLSSTTSLTIPRLPVQRPINRGKVERKLGTIKARFGDVPSAITQVIPLDRLSVLPVEARRLAAGAGDRVARLDPIAVERLPTIDDARTWVEARIHHYNHAERSRVLGGVTRRVAYERARPARLRKGTDLLLALPTASVPVTREGLTVTRDGQTFAFSPFVDNRFVLPIDQLVTLKLHPLGLMAWARLGDHHYRLRPRIEAASGTDAAERVARTQFAAAVFASDEAKAARALVFDTRFGAGAAESDQAAAKALLALKAEQTSKAQETPTPAPDRRAPIPGDVMADDIFAPRDDEDTGATAAVFPSAATAISSTPSTRSTPSSAPSATRRPSRGASRLQHRLPDELAAPPGSALQRRSRRAFLPPASTRQDDAPDRTTTPAPPKAS